MLATIAYLLSVGWVSAQQPESGCVTCHQALTGKQADPVAEFNKSVHAKARVSCVDCHGGDSRTTDMGKAMSAKRGFVGKPGPRRIPKLCARCHADIRRMRPYNIRTDQYAEYRLSQHGKLLFEKGDTRVATCISCHGVHDIRKKDDPESLVYHTRVPQTCAACHSDKARMKGYDIPTDQSERYQRSYHGQILMGKIEGKNPALVPNCANCHGTHGAVPPGVREVANVCGNCHANTASYFGKSPHYLAVQRMGMPRCVDCHGNHEIIFPSLKLFANKDGNICTKCHATDSSQHKLGNGMFALLRDTQDSIDKGEASLRAVERAGLNVDRLKENLETARTKLIEAGPISHTLDLAQVEKLSAQAKEEVAELMVKAENVRKDVRRRKEAFAVIIVIIGVIVGLIYFKRKSLSGRSGK